MASLTLSLLFAWTVLPQDEPRAIRLGDVVEARLEEAGSPAGFVFVPEAAGPFEVWLLSLDFDPRLVARSPDGTEVARDEDSGLDQGARLALDARAGEPLELWVESQDERAGAFRIELVPGRDGRSAPERLEQTVAHLLLLAEQRLARDDREGALAALGRLLTEAEGAVDRGWLEPAAAGLEGTARLALELGSALHRTLGEAFLADVHNRRGEYQDAARLLEPLAQPGALDGLEEADALQIERYVLDRLAQAQRGLDRPDDELRTVRRMVERGYAPTVLEALALSASRLARLQSARGDVEQARAQHERALARVESFAAPATRVEVQYAAGVFHLEQQEYDRARGLLEPVLPLIEGTRRLDLAGLAANANLELGSYARARELFEEVASGPEPYATKGRLGLAKVAFETGAHARCRRLAEGCLRDPGLRDEDRIVALSLAGMACWWLGDEEAAAEHQQRMLALCVEAGNREAEWRARVTYGRVLRVAGANDRAEEHFQRALAIAHEREDRWAEAAALDALALVDLDRGGPYLDSARTRAAAAEQRLIELGREQDLPGPRHTLARVALARGELEQAGLLLEQANAALEGGPTLSELTPLELAGVRSRYVEWGELAQDLTARRLADVPDDDPARARWVSQGFRESARWKGRVLLEGVAGADVGGNAVPDPEPALRAALGDQVLVEYAAGATRLYAYVLDARGLTHHDLGPRAPIEERAARYLALIADPASSAPQVLPLGRRLHDELLGPLLADREGVGGLVFVPSTELARLPLGALVRRAPDEGTPRFDRVEFVADRWATTCAPSSAVLAALDARPERSAPGGVLLMGDAVYEDEVSAADSLRSAGRLPRWERLAATFDEVLFVARKVLEELPADAPGLDRAKQGLSPLMLGGALSLRSPPLDVFVRGEARLEVLREEDLGHYRLLHFAVHGHADPRDLRRTGIALSWEEESGGFLALTEVMGLRLDADLVVLSACQTADGPLLRGEGLLSMAHAFLEAGARSVVASSWQIRDDETLATMREFYEGYLGQGLDPASALRRATRRLRRERGVPPGGRVSDPALGHPYYWAPYVYIGRLP